MNAVENVLHTIIDVLTGRKNLPAHEADELHESLTPGFTAVAPSDADVVAAQKVLDAALAAKAGAEAKAAPVAAPAPEQAAPEGFAPAPSV
jgi:hypothetical protein